MIKVKQVQGQGQAAPRAPRPHVDPPAPAPSPPAHAREDGGGQGAWEWASSGLKPAAPRAEVLLAAGPRRVQVGAGGGVMAGITPPAAVLALMQAQPAVAAAGGLGAQGV